MRGAAAVANELHRHGVVRLEGLFPKPLLKRIATKVMRLHESGALKGDWTVRDIAGRRTTILPFDGPFLEPAFCANKPLLAVIETVLGETARWSSLEVVMAESGAAAQYQHVDAPLRLDSSGRRFKGDLSALPPYALALAVPLVDVDEENGPTAIWPGSHREGLVYPPPSESAIKRRYPMQLMTGKLGQAYLYDYRTFHRGMPNHSAEPRPLLMLVFRRAWFNDPNLEPVASGLRLSQKDRRRIPARARGLFAK